ncbi:methylenetetrahydrofolate--tRNA-(uracil(54)-C(5))-methyltransferase (FADH(2)-oxidizing) TrmFO, partial [Dissulfurirhabdus thermomarina]
MDRAAESPDTFDLTVIGGGLAGSEAAWQAAEAGCRVRLVEMKPRRFSPAHKSPFLGELVCSNSLRSDAPDSAVGLLKEELRRAGSLVMAAADRTRVPAGKALAVDRNRFAAEITAALEAHPRVEIVRDEATALPDTGWVIVATGPLTSDALAAELRARIGTGYLHFYDAIAPIVLGESLDRTVVFAASRYQEGGGDYLNCPMDEAAYRRFVEALLAAEKVPLRDFERAAYFEGCLPIEVMAERGPETLRFGPMKPVGLVDPRTGRTPHAVVQLRREDLEGTLWNMVGFQTKLKWHEQERVFRMIPGLERAEFVRLGSIHRNTFVCAPRVLTPALRLRADPRIFLAGQLSGVEGYVESTAMGLLAGRNAARLARGLPGL